jgi:hypothetical protein
MIQPKRCLRQVAEGRAADHVLSLRVNKFSNLGAVAQRQRSFECSTTKGKSWCRSRHLPAVARWPESRLGVIPAGFRTHESLRLVRPATAGRHRPLNLVPIESRLQALMHVNNTLFALRY